MVGFFLSNAFLDFFVCVSCIVVVFCEVCVVLDVGVVWCLLLSDLSCFFVWVNVFFVLGGLGVFGLCWVVLLCVNFAGF